jgi:hypothetical protein
LSFIAFHHLRMAQKGAPTCMYKWDQMGNLILFRVMRHPKVVTLNHCEDFDAPSEWEVSVAVVQVCVLAGVVSSCLKLKSVKKMWFLWGSLLHLKFVTSKIRRKTNHLHPTRNRFVWVCHSLDLRLCSHKMTFAWDHDLMS